MSGPPGSTNTTVGPTGSTSATVGPPGSTNTTVGPPGSTSATVGPVLDIRNLTVAYTTERGPLATVRDVSLHINGGEIYGLVGESGSGKTTLARAIVRYLPENGRITGGAITLDGTDLLALSPAEMRRMWGSRITMVHQDPAAAVNPSLTIGEQIAEIARTHLGLSGGRARARALEMLARVRMPDPESVARRYAHQLSGGMLQRVLIASALTTNPRLLIMDEPTTALDVTTEAVILDLVRDLLSGYDTAVLYITHNLGVVARLCRRVGVMYAGQLVEQGTVRRIFRAARHPYTIGLLGCVPRIDGSTRRERAALHTIPGHIPRPDHLPPGCVFAPRCPMAEDACRVAQPPLMPAEPDHLTACRRWPEIPRDVDLFAATAREHVPAERTSGAPVLEARDIVKHFPLPRSLRELWQRRPRAVRAVDGMSAEVPRRFTLGIVGESGCGKTTFARCIAGLERADAGDLLLNGVRLPYAVAQRPQAALQAVQMVFQNPDASLNPQRTVGDSVARPLIRLRGLSREQVAARVAELFGAVNLPEDYVKRLPHELSGGEKQRVAIARALAADPAVVICDEPISSLDVSVQASLMNLLAELQAVQGTSYLFISHDLAAVRHLADAVAVVYLGQIWETGPAAEVFAPPYHPYTEALLSAIPVPDPDAVRAHILLEGSVPSAVNVPTGCRFHTRCPRKLGDICEQETPPWQDGARGHRIRCHRPLAELAELQQGSS
jgi:peptide/nickel transport system ATP-binding protein